MVLNLLFKEYIWIDYLKKKKHDIASYPLTHEQKTMVLRFISVDLGTMIQFFSSNDVIFVHDAAVNFFSWAWATELELTKMWLNSLSSKLQLWLNRINSNTIALCRLPQLKKSNLISCCFLLCSTFKYWLWGDVHMGIYVCCKFLLYVSLHNILM